MKIDLQKDKIIVSGKLDFDVHKTLTCGQLFRYSDLGEGRYAVVSKDRCCRIYEDGDSVIIETADPWYFYDYFDLDEDYEKIFTSLSGFGEIEKAVRLGRGIRILRQDFFEVLVSFIISASNNIPRIKGIIERLCQRFGKDKGFYRAFPDTEEFSKITARDFKAAGAGFRDEYLGLLAGKLALDRGFLRGIEALTQREIKDKLKALKGVGDKVASCVMLYGLHMTSCFPVDTWIFKAMNTAELNTPQKIESFYQSRYGSYAGYAQQYIFYAKRNLKETI